MGLLRIVLLSAFLLMANACGSAQAKDECNNYGQWESMIATCSRVIASNPRAGWAYANRSLAYERLLRYDEALADSNRAVELSPNLSDAFSNRAAILVAMKDFDKALLDIRRAIQLDGNNGAAFVNRGYIYEQRGDRDRAIADYRRAAEIQSTPKRSFNVEFARDALKRLGAAP